jgi:hypothetical protein
MRPILSQGAFTDNEKLKKRLIYDQVNMVHGSCARHGFCAMYGDCLGCQLACSVSCGDSKTTATSYCEVFFSVLQDKLTMLIISLMHFPHQLWSSSVNIAS